jgi:hypothetical protein
MLLNNSRIMNPSIGFFTGYYYTTVFLAKDDFVVEYVYLQNREFLKNIVSILNGLIEKNFRNSEVSFMSIYTGVAPLSTLRAVCSWVQGWHRASGVPVIAINDTRHMKSNRKIPLIINMFGGKFAIVESDDLVYIVDKDVLYNDLMQRFGQFECVYSVAIPDHLTNIVDGSYLIISDINSFANDAYKKYLNKEFSKIEDIAPNFDKFFLG